MSDNETEGTAISIRGVPTKALLNPHTITPEEVINLAQLALGYFEIIEAKRDNSPAVLVNQLIFVDDGLLTQTYSAMVAPDLEPGTVVDFVERMSNSQVNLFRNVIHDLNLRLVSALDGARGDIDRVRSVIQAALDSDEFDGIRETPAVESLRDLLADLKER